MKLEKPKQYKKAVNPFGTDIVNQGNDFLWIGKLIVQGQGKTQEFKKTEARTQNILNTLNDREQIEKDRTDPPYIKWAKKNLTAQPYLINTYDGATLDTLEIQFNPIQAISEKKYIINFNGTGGTYQHDLMEMIENAEELQCNVIGFNYRGVGNSTGRPQAAKDLVIDGITQVQHLLDNKIKPENITLKGFSLGGGVATLVAKHFHDKSIKINLFNDRSFSKLSKGASSIVGGGLIGSMIEKIFPAKWEIDAASAYHDIPNEYKGHLIVKSPKENITNKGDTMINYHASLHLGLKDIDENKKNKRIISNKIKHITHQLNQLRTNERDNHPLKEKLDSLKQERQKLKNQQNIFEHKVTAIKNKETEEGHLLPWDEMISRTDPSKSAKQLFYEFFKRNDIKKINIVTPKKKKLKPKKTKPTQTNHKETPSNNNQLEPIQPSAPPPETAQIKKELKEPNKIHPIPLKIASKQNISSNMKIMNKLTNFSPLTPKTAIQPVAQKKMAYKNPIVKNISNKINNLISTPPYKLLNKISAPKPPSKIYLGNIVNNKPIPILSPLNNQIKTSTKKTSLLKKIIKKPEESKKIFRKF